MEEACVSFTLLSFLLHASAGGGGGGGGGGNSSIPSVCSFTFREYVARVTNFFLWFSLVSVTFLLLRKLIALLSLWAQGSRIPGPPARLSFLPGHGHGRRSNRRSAIDLSGYLSEMHEQYGPIVRLWFSPTKLLISVTDVAVIKEILLKAKDKFPLPGTAFPLAFGRSNISVSSFDKVKEGRECLAVYMNGKLLQRVNKIPLKVFECVWGRIECIMSKGILDCRSVSQHISFYILGASLFEEAFLNWSNATLYEELLGMIAKEACFWASYKVPPFWKREYWRYQLRCSRLKHLTHDIVEQSDSFFLEETKSHLISQEEPFGNILGLMFHGCVTITNLVCSILTRLVLHPELQEKIFSEITEVQKTTSKRDSYDVERIHFLLGAVYESARLLPPSPLLQRCSLNHDLTLKSTITVPAGTIFAVPLQLVQMENSIWGEDACQFNPHRFVSKAVNEEGLSEENAISELRNNAAYLPFGSGSRSCIGQNIAILGISKLFVSLLQEYKIRLEPGCKDETKPTTNECFFQLRPSPKIIFLKRKT